MATPDVSPLVRLMFPPLALERYGAAVEVGSADETWIVESTVTLPPEEFRLTVPPAPPKPVPGAFSPVVALVGVSTITPPVALTVKVPPFAPVEFELTPLPPSK